MAELTVTEEGMGFFVVLLDSSEGESREDWWAGKAAAVGEAVVRAARLAWRVSNTLPAQTPWMPVIDSPPLFIRRCSGNSPSSWSTLWPMHLHRVVTCQPHRRRAGDSQPHRAKHTSTSNQEYNTRDRGGDNIHQTSQTRETEVPKQTQSKETHTGGQQKG